MQRKYDWVVRVRPDIVLLNPVPSPRALSVSAGEYFVSAHRLGPISDHFWISKREVASIAFECPVEHMKSGKDPWVGFDWGPEKVLLHCLTDQGLKVVHMMDVPIAVVHFKEGLQCHRLNESLVGVRKKCDYMTQMYLSTDNLTYS